MHQRKFSHRDIKPENIVFDSDFNPKMIDFGWVADLDEKKQRNSLCGTFEYMSPEIIRLESHDHKNDVWALGILFYEMLHGNPPFKARSLKEIREALDLSSIMIKKSLHKETKNLLKKVLQDDP